MATQKSKEELRKEYKLKMERQRKFKRMLAIVVMALVVIVVGIVLSLTVFFKISTVEVTGVTQYSQDEVVSVSGIDQGDNLFLVNKDKVVEHVSQALPFTGDITVSRSFPNKIIIHVTDSDVACAVKYKKGYVLINDQEKVLATAKTVKGVNTILKEQYDKKAAAEEAAAAKTETTTDTTAAETTEITDTTTASDTTSSTESTTAEGESTTAEESTTTESTTATTQTTASKTKKNTIKISSSKIDQSVILLTGLSVEEAEPGYQLKVSNENIFEDYQEIMDKLAEYGLDDVTAMDLSSPSAITITYQDRIIMSIGSTSGLDKKLQMAQKVLEEQNQVSDELTGTLDLTISGRAYFSEGTTKITVATTTTTTSEEDSEAADSASTTSGGSESSTKSASTTATTEAATGSINTTYAVQ